MHVVTPRSAFSAPRSAREAARFAALLRDFYDDLVEEGVPDDLASLVRQLDSSPSTPSGDRKLAIVVDADQRTRSLAMTLLEETGLRVIDCASGEAALEIVRTAPALAFVFADAALSGALDGVELARRILVMRPDARVVVTTDESAGPDLPPNAVRLRKPWSGLDVLLEAEKATSGSPATSIS